MEPETEPDDGMEDVHTVVLAPARPASPAPGEIPAALSRWLTMVAALNQLVRIQARLSRMRRRLLREQGRGG